MRAEDRKMFEDVYDLAAEQPGVSYGHRGGGAEAFCVLVARGPIAHHMLGVVAGLYRMLKAVTS